jgi:hypothetical protein
MHWTNWYIAPYLVNPSYTELSNNELNTGILYRNQWQNVPAGFNTISAFAHSSIPKEKMKNFSLGTQLSYDVAGTSRFTNTQMSLSVGYKKTLLRDQLLISGALQPAWQFGSYDYNRLTFSKNYNGERFDASINSGENFINNTTNSFILNSGFYTALMLNELSIGIGYSRQYDAGIKKASLQSTTTQSEKRQNIITQIIYPYAKATTFQYNTALYFLNKQREWINTVSVRHQPDLKKPNYLLGGITYRHKDAVALNIGYEKKDWIYFMSYDFNISQFSLATRYQGGIELGLRYRFIYPERIQLKHKQCPIYL